METEGSNNFTGGRRMNWEDIIKAERKQEFLDELNSDGIFSPLAGWGRFFDEMGAIDEKERWYFVEKPWKWQDEYDLTNALIDALNENQGEWKHGDPDFSDMGAVSEYMHEKQLFFFDQQKIKEHIKELKGEKQ